MLVKKIILTFTTLLISITALAVNPPKPVKIKETNNIVVTPAIAYRYDIFKWSIPSTNFPDKKVSELTWKNYAVQPSIKIELEPKANWFTFLAQTKYGYILKNKSKKWDMDWYIHKKKSGKVISAPDSHSLSSVKGNILDLSGAVGYSLNLSKNNLLTFYVGYDYMDYRNKQYGIRQLINNRNDLLYPFNQLISRYNFKTKTPWIGLSVSAPLNDRFSIVPTIKFYSFKYSGKGYWLLVEGLKKNPSFKDTAKGQGLGADVDLLYKYSDNLDFKINLETKRFKMKKGEQKTYYNKNSGKGEITTTNRLFDLSLKSFLITTGVRYKF